MAEVCIKLSGGGEVVGKLAKPFQSKNHEIYVDSKNRKQTYNVDDISRILFMGELLPQELMPGETIEEVICTDGARYTVKVLQSRQLDDGFFGISFDGKEGIARIFFCKSGVKERLLFNPQKQATTSKNNVSDVVPPLKKIDTIMTSGQRMVHKGKLHLGETLKAANLITDTQLQDALAIQSKKGDKHQHLGEVLIEQDIITEEQMLMSLALQCHLRFVSLQNTKPVAKALKLISIDIAKKLNIFPLELLDNHIVIATCNPTNTDIIDTIRFHTNLWVELVVATSADVHEQISKHYITADTLHKQFVELQKESAVEDKPLKKMSALELEATQGPIVQMANKVLMDAVFAKASDIHVLADAEALKILFRQDGMLKPHLTLDRNMHQSLIARFKILAGMNITEHRLPQDGRIQLAHEKIHVEMRVSCMPGLHGENIVFRLLGTGGGVKPLDKLGLADTDVQQIRRISRGHHGMMLVTGPTGSGKSTTLSSVLNDLVHEHKHLLSLEDPVETEIPGVNQIPINEKVGFGFAEALRNVLRHDPDVIMVGEIRDTETARIAVQAALTGHVLLATLHTNSAAASFTRLIDMGVAPYLIAATVKGIVSQQLIPRLCKHCIEPCEPDEGVMYYIREAGIDLPDPKNFKASGCTKCRNTGVLGRVLVYEFLPVGREIHDLVVAGAPSDEISKKAREIGIRTMMEMGIDASQKGLTSMAHISTLFME